VRVVDTRFLETVGKTNVNIWIDNADALNAEFKSKGVKITREICDQPYGCRDFDIDDCNGLPSVFRCRTRWRMIGTRNGYLSVAGRATRSRRWADVVVPATRCAFSGWSSM